MAGTRSRGRPTKITEELVKTITEYIKAGNYPEVAASLAGVSRATFYNWLKKGHEHKTGIHHDFLDSIKKAEDYAEAAAVERIRRSGKDNWTALAWWLERKYPRKWGRQQTIEIDGKIQSENKTKIECDLPKDPNLRSKARDLISEIRNTEKRE